MKILLVSLVSLALGATLTLSSCKDSDPTAEEIFLKQASATWIASSKGVELDGVAVNKVFAGFSITITDQSTFTTTNGNSPIWPASGTFTLKKASSVAGFDFVRNDQVEITVAELTDQKLVLEFSYVGKPGRSSSVSGHYVFDLTKKP